MTRFWFPVLAAALLAATGCHKSSTPAVGQVVTTTTAPQTVTLRAPGTGNVPALTVTSAAFANGGTIPASEAQNGCGGTNASPDLTWSAGPAATKSYVVTMFDPDAPTGSGFWHWTLYNIPSATTTVAAGTGTSPAVGASGLSDYGTLGYGGPCPPVGDGAHHYAFVVSALDTMLTGLPPSTTGAYLTFNMRGHIIAQGSYLGLFSR